ncbi:transglutaminase domain-containing protein [Natronomonas sp.]|uniref:transglutaminase domain-containing protein n=1 Tax=Natronomonas sp. TaxID=2184060 RepID=UPI003975A9CA
MSVAKARATVVDRVPTAVDDLPLLRAIALGGVAVVLGSFLSVLHQISVITGDPTLLYYAVAGSLLSGTIAARVIRPRTAAVIAMAAGIVGTYLYIETLPGGGGFLVLAEPILDDITGLLSGLSVLRIVNADVWALSIAPGPVFLTWYLAVRRRYVAASAVGGAGLGLLVLTGDATNAETLVGVTGVVVAVAIGDCERRDERFENVDTVALAVAAMVVLTLFVGVVPGAIGSVLPESEFGDSGSTIESSLVYAGDSAPVTGTVELSPERRYTVEAEEPANWRVGTYDRYTGGGWVRSGSSHGYDGRLSGPPGETRRLEQEYTAESTIATLPAARQPTRIDGVPVPVQVTPGGSFEPTSTLETGESYTVESEITVASADELRSAGTAYPDEIESRYTQLPDDTPDRVGERTEQLTANAENPYDTARVLEYWFQTEYDYSLEVDRPRGDVADAFLFEMDAGYCTYFATTMTAMLRTQGIPARMAIGYTPGEQVDDDEWVVRGYDSHAWVEVYIPEHGWIEFDPTPSEPREETAQQALGESEAGGTDGLDGTSGDDASNTTETETETETDPESGTETPEQEGTATPGAATEEPIAAGDAPDRGDGREASADGESESPLSSIPLPSGEQLGAGLAIALAAFVAVRRSGVTTRLYRAWWLRRLPSGPPAAVVAGAYRRAVYLESLAGRPKPPGETPRQFFIDADERLRRIERSYERARYGPGVDEAAAADARDALAAVRRERSRIAGWLKKPDRGSR